MIRQYRVISIFLTTVLLREEQAKEMIGQEKVTRCELFQKTQVKCMEQNLGNGCKVPFSTCGLMIDNDNFRQNKAYIGNKNSSTDINQNSTY